MVEISKTLAVDSLFFNIDLVLMSSSSLISIIISIAPSASILNAVDLPIPDPAPVTNTTLSLNLFIGCAWVFICYVNCSSAKALAHL